MNRVVLYGLLVGAIILSGISYANVWSAVKLESAQEWVEHTHKVENAISHVLSILQDAETGQRGFLLTGDRSYLEAFRSAQRQISPNMTQLRQLTIDNPSQQKRLQQIEQLISIKLDELNETIFLKSAHNPRAALSLVKSNKGKKTMDSIRALMRDMQQEEDVLLQERKHSLEHQRRLAYWVQAMGMFVLSVVGLFVVFRVRKLLLSRMAAESELEYMANHDVLTGLESRRLGMERLSLSCAMARRARTKTGLLFVDLDGFKDVNDMFGHQTGDAVLVTIAQRLSSCLREVDTVARLGGDEFMIVLSNINSDENASQVAQKVIDAVSQPIVIDDQQMSVSASIGIALYPDHAQDGEALIKCADTAMYTAKNKGKHQFATA